MKFGTPYGTKHLGQYKDLLPPTDDRRAYNRKELTRKTTNASKGLPVGELIDLLPEVYDRSHDSRTRCFAYDMMKRSFRPGWKPTPKQVAAMRRLVTRWVGRTGMSAPDQLFDFS